MGIKKAMAITWAVAPGALLSILEELNTTHTAECFPCKVVCRLRLSEKLRGGFAWRIRSASG